MARSIHKLSALYVSKTIKQGLHSDGGGLYLQVTNTGAKSWVFRFMIHGKAHMMGLGALQSVSLQLAREKAQSYRSMIQAGKHPLKEKLEAKKLSLLEDAKHITFEQCAEAYIEAHKKWLEKYETSFSVAIHIKNVRFSLDGQPFGNRY